MAKRPVELALSIGQRQACITLHIGLVNMAVQARVIKGCLRSENALAYGVLTKAIAERHSIEQDRGRLLQHINYDHPEEVVAVKPVHDRVPMGDTSV